MNPECFLCDPDRELVYAEGPAGVALSGLGPLVEGYSVLGAATHVRSAADLALKEKAAFVEFAKRVRADLSQRYGPCLLTEHGRVPVCQSLSGLNQPHCYHAHLLLFPNAPSVVELATSMFSRSSEASSFGVALARAQKEEDYFLLSPSPVRFLVLAEPRSPVRQLARLLVATVLGTPALADWQTHPMRENAVAVADRLRSSLRDTGLQS